MKQPRKPTREEKIIIDSHGLKPENWMIGYIDSDVYMKLVNRKTGNTRIIDKFRRVKKK